ncbi:MAG: dGTP triphosphohydrolase [Planctomycetota bacterium]
MNNAQRESLLLAPYAMHAADSAGREHPEAAHPYRSPYQRDRDRVVHCAAYRRLAHKTQVFTGGMIEGRGGDYHRTRLTHTQEVASVARTLARALRLNEDLVEALALLHDIGHPPFGHAGEELLDTRLAAAGGRFNHNDQAVRIVTRLEHRYSGIAGLNLTHEVLDGQRRRASKTKGAATPQGGSAASPLLEVQVVDAADSVAYDAHDADDALELGMIELGDLAELSLWSEAMRRVRGRYAALSDAELRRATIHELLDWQVGDLLASTRALLIERHITDIDDVRHGPLLAVHSTELAEQKRQLESFLFRRVYRHPLVLAHRMEATAALGELFDDLLAGRDLPAEPGADQPLDHAPYAEIARDESPERAVADYLASVTERHALDAAGRASFA